MLAYYETVRTGLVPCKVISITRQANGSLHLEARVTATRGGYERGGIIGDSSMHVIPRGAVRKFRSSPFPKIMPFSWPDVAEKAGFPITQA